MALEILRIETREDTHGAAETIVIVSLVLLMVKKNQVRVGGHLKANGAFVLDFLSLFFLLFINF
jgi:hypothetical protein